MSSTTPDQPTEPTPEGAQTPAPTPEVSATPDGAAGDQDSGEPEAGEPEEHVLVDPARVRRAPKYGAFLTVGAILGIVVGLWFGTWLVDQVDPRRGDIALLKPGVFIIVIIAATTTVTVLLAGLLALIADRRSLRGR